jgi:hypothetical protein
MLDKAVGELVKRLAMAIMLPARWSSPWYILQAPGRPKVTRNLQVLKAAIASLNKERKPRLDLSAKGAKCESLGQPAQVGALRLLSAQGAK